MSEKITFPDGFARTENQDYDLARLRWERFGYDSSPTCEDCAADMTGSTVVEKAGAWLCATCAAKPTATALSPEAEQAAERQAMGIT